MHLHTISDAHGGPEWVRRKRVRRVRKRSVWETRLQWAMLGVIVIGALLSTFGSVPYLVNVARDARDGLIEAVIAARNSVS